MNMDTIRICPTCRQPLPANAPEGLCPRCLLKAAASPPSEPQSVTTSSIPGDIVDIGDPVAVGKCLPQFEILELLGRGGMGVVYKARQLNLDRIVALKILPPVDSQSADFVERFRREARSLAKLSHPNIVAVHDFGESGGLYYFAMEFVDGANLREMIRTGKMRPEEALAVVPKICDALQFAHEEGVVHRDVKPENILIDKRGRVKIADFGLAKLLRREQADHTLTMTGMTLGTPRYMAPEQLDKPESVDHRADIYSLGVVFYEMLTGEVPMGRFAPPSEKVRIDVRLDEIVLHALERDADRRYQHVSQVRDDVEKVTSKPQVAPIPKSDAPLAPLADAEQMQMSVSVAKAALAVLAMWASAFAIISVVGMALSVYLLWRGKDPVHTVWNSLVLSATLAIASFVSLTIVGSSWRYGRQRLAWIAGLTLVAVAAGFAIGRPVPAGLLPIGVWIFFGGISIFCALLFRFGPGMPAAFAELAAARREALARKAAGDSESTPTAESDAVRRARASWFGRRSERFRTLLPPALVFLELVFILASFVGWPSPWLEWTQTYTPHEHGTAVSASSFGFHPFTFSFLLLLIGFTLPFIAGRYSRIDNLVRYGCRFRELRKDIQRRAKMKIFSCLAAAILLPFLIAVLFQVIASGGLHRIAGATYTEYILEPNSKAYDELLIDLPFYTKFDNDVVHYRRPNQWDMAIGLKTKDSAEPVTMDIEMPSLQASYLDPRWSNHPHPIVLDLDELTNWMRDVGTLDVKDEKVKKEATELMSLLKRFSRQAPVNFDEYMNAAAEVMPGFRFSGMRGWPGRNGSFSSTNGDWFTGIYLGSAVIFLALYFVVAIRIQRAAFALDREVRERGEGVLAKEPLPRVKFSALPAYIRASVIRQSVFWGGLLLFVLPAFVSRWESAQPKRVRQTYHYAFVPQNKYEKVEFGNIANKPSPLLKHFQEVVISVPFESYESNGEHWFVQPHPAKLEVTFCRPKNFSDKPGEVKWVEQPGKGVPEGENFSFTVELPGLHANMDYITNRQSATLDEEELLNWMQYTIASTIEKPAGGNWSGWGVTKPDGTQVQLYSLSMGQMPELKALAAELMAFLKKYATSAPTTQEAFFAALQQTAPMLPPTELKTTSLRMTGWHIFPTEELTHESLATGFAIAASLLISLALFPLLKRSAVRAAMRQGTLNLAPQTPAPANTIQPDAENVASKPRPGFLRHIVVPMLILLVLCSVVGTLCIAMFEKKDDTVLRMCWRVGGIVVPLTAALLLVRWARLRGIAGSIGAFALRSLSLRSWTWPLAALLLVPAAIYIPHPGKLPEPKEVQEVFRPAVLLAPEGDSYQSYSFDEPDWTKLNSVVYIINRRIFDTQQVTRSLGWDPKDGMSLGFFHRSATWKYELTALQFGNKRDESKPVWLPDEEVAKLREKITLEMNLHDIRVSHDPARKSQMKEDEMYQRANRFVDILNNGRHAESVVCWQNAVVLLAWLSLPLGVLTLIWKLREIFVACVGALAFALSAASGLIGGYNNLDWAAIPLAVIAAVGVVILFALHCFGRPAGIRAALPTFTLIVLGAGAGALPWMMAFLAPIPGWHLWHGVAFSLVYFALLLIHLIASGEKFARLRAVSMLIGGLAVIALAFICTTWPPVVAASINGAPTTFIARVVLPGLVLAENLAFLTAIIGAVQLRQALAAKQDAGTGDAS